MGSYDKNRKGKDMSKPEISIEYVYSEPSTLQDGTWYYPLHGNTGWICPKCGRVNAPWVAYCPCTNTWVIPPQPYTYVTIDGVPSVIW